MPKITLLPHEDLCPQGTEFECRPGARLCDQLRANGVAIEHACEKSCVCTTCHVLIRKGFSSLRPASEAEEDQLGKAWGLESTSRLSCQVRVSDADLVVEIPRYTLNIVSEHH
jgi:ferredoxin, 2Fe-2S